MLQSRLSLSLSLTLLQAKLHTRRFAITPYRFVVNSLLYGSYRMGGTSPSTTLMPQLVQAVILPQHDAFVDSKGSVNLLRISCVLLTSLHTPHVLRAFFYTNRRKGVKMIFK